MGLADRLLAALRAGGGTGDPGALLVNVGMFTTPPPAALAQKIVAEAFADDARVTVETGRVQLEHLPPPVRFAVIAASVDPWTEPPTPFALAWRIVEGPMCDVVSETEASLVRPDAAMSEEGQALTDALALEPGELETAPPLATVAEQLRAAVQGCLLVTHRGGRRLLERLLGFPLPAELVHTGDLARRLVEELHSGKLEAVCMALDIDLQPPPRSAAAEATAVAHALAELIRLGRIRGYAPPDLPELARTPQRQVVDFSRYAFTASQLADAPEMPGVYRFFDAQGDLLYVGASENLHRRLADHFAPKASEHSRRIRAKVHDLSWESFGSALEAFLREAELIRSLDPPLNRRGSGLGDACYLRVMRRHGEQRIVAGRKPVKRGRSFGPFRFEGGIREAVTALEEAFAGAMAQAEEFLASGDLALAPRRNPTVTAIARAREAVRGEWAASMRAVLLPGGAIALLGGGTVARLVPEGSGAAVVEALTALRAERRASTPDHLSPDEAALGQLMRRYARGLPTARLDTLADLGAVAAAITTLREDAWL